DTRPQEDAAEQRPHQSPPVRTACGALVVHGLDRAERFRWRSDRSGGPVGGGPGRIGQVTATGEPVRWGAEIHRLVILWTVPPNPSASPSSTGHSTRPRRYRRWDGAPPGRSPASWAPSATTPTDGRASPTSNTKRSRRGSKT